MTTEFLLDKKLHHVGLSWIISPSKRMKCDVKENNNPNWLTKIPRHKTAKILGLNSLIIIMKLDKSG